MIKTLVLGGMRAGKSAMAQHLAEQRSESVIYLATATPGDAEMAQRIARHQQDRPSHWRLIEEPIELAKRLKANDQAGQVILVDCLTLWLTNLLMLADDNTLAAQQQALLDTVSTLEGELILVSNEINMGVVPMDALSRRFCDEAGRLHQALAQQCDEVMLMVAGLPIKAKG